MNVGIFFSNSSPESGGGFVYEQELLSSLLSIVHESKHNFIIFSFHDLRGFLKDEYHGKISNVIVPRYNIFRIVYQHFFYYFNSPYCSKIYFKLSGLQKMVRKNQIGIMFFLNPSHDIIDCPYITPVWDLEHRLQPWFPEVSVQGRWDARENYYDKVLKRASIIITGTKSGQDEISSLYGIPKNRIKILPLPTPGFVLTEQNKTAPDIIKKLKIKNEFLFFPAQFWPHKNHAGIIRALKILHDHYNLRLSVVFVGSDKGNLSYVQKMVSDQNLTEFVTFIGFVSQAELICLYQNAFALLFPTFFGPDNLPPLESFALRCPVIASRVSGSDEQLADAAILIDPKNPEEIAKAIVTLYNDPLLRAQLIKKGYARAIRWTGIDFMRELFLLLDNFENIRRCWDK